MFRVAGAGFRLADTAYPKLLFTICIDSLNRSLPPHARCLRDQSGSGTWGVVELWLAHLSPPQNRVREFGEFCGQPESPNRVPATPKP